MTAQTPAHADRRPADSVVPDDATDVTDAAPGPPAPEVTPPGPRSGSKSGPVPRAAAAGPPARDWQTHLIELLSRLEHHRLQLVGTRLGADAEFILDKCEASVQLAEDLAAGTAFGDAHAAARMDAMAKAGGVFGAANDARRPGGRSLFKSMLSAFTADDPGHAPAVRAVVEASQDALSAYCSLFTSHYPTSLAARGWVDAASAFLADFKQTGRELAES